MKHQVIKIKFLITNDKPIPLPKKFPKQGHSVILPIDLATRAIIVKTTTNEALNIPAYFHILLLKIVVVISNSTMITAIVVKMPSV